MGAMRVQCPLCKELFPVPTEVIGVDGHQVIARLDRSEVFGHMDTCLAGRKPLGAKAKRPAVKAAIPAADLAGRVNLLLDNRAFVAEGGSRACTMCGVKGAECLDSLGKLDPRDKHPQPACCPACGVGNTHPAPGEVVGSCAAWAAEKVGPVR